MAKTTPTPEETLEAVNKELTAKNENLEKENQELKTKNADLEKENKAMKESQANTSVRTEELEKELSEAAEEITRLKEVNAKHTKEVEGTFKYEADEDSPHYGKVFTFKTGHLKTRDKSGALIESAELIKAATDEHKALMEHLIEIGYGGLEIVETEK